MHWKCVLYIKSQTMTIHFLHINKVLWGLYFVKNITFWCFTDFGFYTRFPIKLMLN